MTRSRPVVAFQGELGSFSEQAVHRWWDGAAVPLPQRDCQRVVDAVSRGAADFGVLPVHNTIAGDVAESRAAIGGNQDVSEEGTITLEIVQSLLALPGVPLDQIRTVASHPVALAQCSAFFADHPHLAPVQSYDTAGAARDVAAHASQTEAAIASPAAAARYGLDVLLSDVSDAVDNRTTFAIISVRGGPHREDIQRRRQAENGQHGARVNAIRGATTVRADHAAEVCNATAELLGELASQNDLRPEDVVSGYFTVTPDLRSEFPARAARELGWDDVAMLCATSIPVPGSVPRCIRVMLHVYTAAGREELRHIYLHGAAALRPDLAER